MATTVAELAVKLTAQASDFDKVMQGAEAKLNSFANKLANPLNTVRGLGGSAFDAIANPFSSLLTDVSRFGALVPGIGLGMEAFAHPIQAAEEAMGRLIAVGKDAEDFGVSSQFMRGFQLSAGPEQEAAEKALRKLMIGKGAAGDMSDNEQFIRNIIAEGHAIEDAAQRWAFAANKVGGKAAGGMVELFQGGTEKLDAAIRKVKELNLAEQGNITIAEQWKKIRKDISLIQQGHAENSMLSGGLMGIGLEQLKTGKTAPDGFFNLMQGGKNWMTELFGGEGTLTGDIGNKVFNKAWSDLLDAEKSGAPKDALAGYRKSLTEIGEAMDSLGVRGEMTQSLAKRLMSIGAGASALVPKGPKTTAEIMEENAREAEKNWDITKHLIDENATLAGTFGMNTKAAEQFTGAVKGLNAEQLELLASNRDLRDAAALVAAGESPTDKMLKDLTRLDELRGQLGDDQYRKALRRMQPKSSDITGDTSANVALSGAEWAHAFSRGSSPVESKTEEQLDEAKKQTELQVKIEDRLRDLNDKKPAVLNVPPGG